MNVLALTTRAIAQLVSTVGDAMMSVKVAASIELDAEPGQDYDPSWQISTGKGFWEKVETTDYPNTAIQISDKTLVLLQCAYDVELHDYVLVDNVVHHVHGVKPEMVGATRVLQKLLLRVENRAGIAWASSDLVGA